MKRIAAIISATALLLGLSAPSASATTTLKIATLNLCGSVCLEGELNNTATKVAAQAKSLGVDAFVLNEVCAGQYDAIKAKLGSGWSTYYTTTVGHGPCQTSSDITDDRFGNALLVKGTVSSKVVTSLPWGKAPTGSKGREPRSLLCATAVMRSQTIKLCTVHLSPNSLDNTDQAKEVVDNTQPLVATNNLVLAGDMNSQPGSTTINNYLTYLDSTNLNHLVSGNDAGAKEIDWVLTTGGIPTAAITATDNAGSDHRWLVGSTSF